MSIAPWITSYTCVYCGRRGRRLTLDHVMPVQVPFQARCIAKRSISPLEVGEQIEVIGMPPEAECEHEMFVQIRWERRTFSVPLSQLEGIGIDQDTRQAIEDWHYWVEQGHSL